MDAGNLYRAESVAESWGGGAIAGARCLCRKREQSPVRESWYRQSLYEIGMSDTALGSTWIERLLPGSESSHRQHKMGWSLAGERLVDWGENTREDAIWPNGAGVGAGQGGSEDTNIYRNSKLSNSCHFQFLFVSLSLLQTYLNILKLFDLVLCF